MGEGVIVTATGVCHEEMGFEEEPEKRPGVPRKKSRHVIEKKGYFQIKGKL